MKFNFWGSIENLTLPNNTKIPVKDQMFIIPSEDVIDLIDQQHEKLFGTFSMFLLSEKPLLIILGDYDPSNIVGRLRIIRDQVFDFTTGLWFVKDNSICIRPHYFIPEILINGSVGYYTGSSNAKGFHEPIEFTLEEIEISVKIMRKLHEVCPPPNAASIMADKINKHKELVSKELGSNHFLDYDFPRITRAYFMLGQARVTTAPAVKITFYMSAFECLFSDGNNDAINYKLSQRIAFFLESEKAARLEIKASIKEGYDVRSSYIHGAELSKKLKSHESLMSISVKVDDLLRRSFLKAIYEYGEQFNLPNDKFNKWLEEEIIYGQP